MRPQNGCRSPEARTGGFTLVELLVALVVLSVGLLAVVAAGTSIARLEGDAARDALAAMMAESRFERLRALPCAPATGRDSARGVAEAWELAPGAGRVRDMRESVRVAGSGGRSSHTESYRSAAAC